MISWRCLSAVLADADCGVVVRFAMDAQCPPVAAVALVRAPVRACVVRRAAVTQTSLIIS
jgi:hypothetical protein